jgi:hypothetical protein
MSKLSISKRGIFIEKEAYDKLSTSSLNRHNTNMSNNKNFDFSGRQQEPFSSDSRNTNTAFQLQQINKYSYFNNDQRSSDIGFSRNNTNSGFGKISRYIFTKNFINISICNHF